MQSQSLVKMLQEEISRIQEEGQSSVEELEDEVEILQKSRDKIQWALQNKITSLTASLESNQAHAREEESKLHLSEKSDWEEEWGDQ